MHYYIDITHYYIILIRSVFLDTIMCSITCYYIILSDITSYYTQTLD